MTRFSRIFMILALIICLIPPAFGQETSSPPESPPPSSAEGVTASGTPAFVPDPALVARSRTHQGGGALLLGTGIGAAVAAFPVWFYSIYLVLEGDPSSIEMYYAGDALWLYGGAGINFGAASITLGTEMGANFKRSNSVDLVPGSVANNSAYWDVRGHGLAGHALLRHGSFTFARGLFDVLFLLGPALDGYINEGDGGVYLVPGLVMMGTGVFEILVGAIQQGAAKRKARTMRNAAMQNAVLWRPQVSADPSTGAFRVGFGLAF